MSINVSDDVMAATVESSKITAGLSACIEVDDANVVAAGIGASDDLNHVIDADILPPSAQ